MISRSEWDARQLQWAECNRWESTQTPPEHSPEDALADAGAILEWIPESVQAEERDPERLGVRRMHALLGLLKAE